MAIYRHYTGEFFSLLYEAEHSGEGERMVVYRSQGTRKVWVMPHSLFFGKVTLEGKEVPRFLDIGSAFTCRDCEGSTENYMVHNALWGEFVPEDDHQGGFFICLTCLEDRMGRELTIKDFTDKPINRALRFGLKLARRKEDKLLNGS